MVSGDIEIAFSNEMWLEYEEAIVRSSGVMRWQHIARFFDGMKSLHRNIIQVEPTFRFAVISTDPDDNKGADCAIVSGAKFIVAEDQHFAALIGSGYRPQPITPQAFVGDYLLLQRSGPFLE